jgi:hypothetical protein
MAALSFPNFDLMTTLRVAQVAFRLEPQVELRRQGSGASQARDLAPSIWTAEVTSTALSLDALDVLQATVEALDGRQPFYLWNKRRRIGPQLDPDGSTLGESEVTILAIDDDNKRMSLQGLPVGYTLSIGDMLSFAYGSAPSNVALHRVVEAAAAVGDADGKTGLFEVRPHIRPGADADASVTLVRPYAMMTLVQGSFRPVGGRNFGSAVFSAVQHIRAS